MLAPKLSQRSILIGWLTCLTLAAALLNACGAPMDASKARADAQIQAGAIPPAGELRVAEYLNYYKQDFPAPVNTTLGLNLRPGNPQLPTDGGETWLQIGLQARGGASEFVAPLNLALVIDTSGSMSDADKMPYLKESLRLFLHSLAPNDRVALVTYADTAQVRVPSRAVDDGAWIDAAVSALTPDGSTNLYDGMVQGLEQVAQNFDTRRNNRVILLTDGIANRGVTDPDQIAATARAYNDRGIYLSTIGLGQQYNDKLLSQLATQGKGGYHFVGSAADMDKIFRQEVSGLLQKAASDVSVTLRPAPGVRVLGITGYDGAPPDGPLTIKLQDMGTGDSQVLLAHLQVTPLPGGTQTLGDIELRYQDLFAQRQATAFGQAQVDVGSFYSYDPLSEPSVLRNVTVQRTAEGLKTIDRLYKAQHYTEAWQLAAQLEQQLNFAAQRTGDEQVQKDAATMRRYEDTLARWVQYQTGHAPQASEDNGNAPPPVRGRLPTPGLPGTEIEIR